MLSKTAILEAILFSSPEPVKATRIMEVLDCTREEFQKVILELTESLSAENRGVVLREVAEGLQLVTKPEAHDAIRQINNPRQYRLSKPTLEVLAIVAYKQPVTRVDIEDVRGVKCERALITLLDKGLIREVGRKESIGRPILYGTTDSFLAYFNLRTLKDLPNPATLYLN